MEQFKLDRIDRQILGHLLLDARKTFTDIAKELNVSSGTIHIRVKKMEKAGVIRGASLQLDYENLGYGFIAFVGIYLNRTLNTSEVIDELKKIPEVTVAHIATGRFGIFAKVRCRDTKHAKDIIFMIDDVDGVSRTETMISLDESINDKKRLMHRIFNELN